MRILLITDFYWPYLGGVEQHVRTLARSLADRGHSVTVATLAKPGLPAIDADGPVAVRRLTSTTQRLPRLFSNTERPWAPPIADPAITLQLRRLIIEQRPEIVHGHDWLARSFLPLRRWSERRFGARFVSSLHYYTLSCAKKNLMQAALGEATEQPCSGPAPRKCLQCARGHYGAVIGPVTALANAAGAAAEKRAVATMIAVSAATATGNNVGDRRVAVVPNFLPVSDSRDGQSEDDDLELLQRLPPGDFILFVGDLRPMKGLDVLLAAHARLATSMPLVLIGKSWPDTPEFPAGVIVHDRWPNSAVLKAWRRCSIGVAPSVWAEPFGIVVIEAMAAGRAVVASDCGGIPEIIEDGLSGLLVPPGDVDALRQALDALIGDPERRAALGAAAARRAEAFAAEAVVPQIESIYERALAAPARPRRTSR